MCSCNSQESEADFLIVGHLHCVVASAALGLICSVMLHAWSVMPVSRPLYTGHPHTPHGTMHELIPSHNCSSTPPLPSPPLPQGIVADDQSTSQHAEDSWGEEGRPCGHLHVNVSSCCGSHVGLRSHWSCAQVGPLSVCTLR